MIAHIKGKKQLPNSNMSRSIKKEQGITWAILYLDKIGPTVSNVVHP